MTAPARKPDPRYAPVQHPTDDEEEGHMERSHPGAVRLDFFPEAPTP